MTKKVVSSDYIRLILYFVALVVGILIIATKTGSEIIIVIIGIALLAYGVITLLFAVKRRKQGIGINLAFPVIILILGAVVLIFYKQSANVLMPLAIGAWALISGVPMLIGAIGAKKVMYKGWIVMLIVAVIVMALGIFILSSIVTGADILGGLLGTFVIVFSIISIIGWFTQNSFNKKFLI